MDARLDETTRNKVDELAKRFHQPRAAVLCHIMQWGLSRGQTGTLDGGESDGPARHLFLYINTELHARVEQAATTAGVKIAPWLRHMVRQITINDFPASWQEERSEERSYDSHLYDDRFMLRLDQSTREKLQDFVERFAVSKASGVPQRF
jgi:hypothetical protein